MLSMSNTRIVGLVEVADAQRQLTCDLFESQGKKCPPFYDTIKALIAAQGAADGVSLAEAQLADDPTGSGIVSGGTSRRRWGMGGRTPRGRAAAA